MNLSKAQEDVVREILREVFGNKPVEAYLFGSRVDGTATKASDLDILLKGPQPIPLKTMALLREKFEESNLPFRVDLLDDHTLSPEFRARIMTTSRRLIF